ncbi:MAG: hypothetical protein KF812_00305 [Fimbriimonadaceae bacterium]|nr:hypothetical protein [Fimbriimonadaceae bacterium]
MYLRSVLVLVLVATWTHAIGALGWNVPNDPVMGVGTNAIPEYFSGCNSRAFISAYTLSEGEGETQTLTPSIVKSQLFINDELIEEQNCPVHPTLGIPLPLFSMGHSIMFDAAHYGGAGVGTIVIKQKVWEYGSTSPAENSYSVSSKSDAILAGYHSVDANGYAWYSYVDIWSTTQWAWTPYSAEYKISNALTSKFAQMDYDPDVLNSMNWAASTFLSGWSGKNNIFVALHGAPAEGGLPPLLFGASEDPWSAYPGFPSAWPPPTASFPLELIIGTYPEPATTPSATIASNVSLWRIRYYRIAQIGTGLPPFNTSAEPPINLAFIYSCEVASGGGNSDPGIAGDSLYPNGNVYTAVSEFPENQSAVMFEESVQIAAATALRDHCYYWMQIGYSVRRAMDKWEDYMADSDTVFGDSADVYGDHATRISRVYLPSYLSQSTTYVRSL